MVATLVFRASAMQSGAPDTLPRARMAINTKKFLVREHSAVDLKKWPTRVDPVYDGEDDYRKLLKDHVGRLSAQQELLYASNSYAVLLVFQAMDAAGKDGVISHVMSGVNPQGCD